MSFFTMKMPRPPTSRSSADCPRLTLSFDAVEELAGVPLDHSFLKYKKELIPFGYTVGKISMKEQTVTFSKICEDKNTSR